MTITIFLQKNVKKQNIQIFQLRLQLFIPVKKQTIIIKTMTKAINYYVLDSIKLKQQINYIKNYWFN